jgi:lysophospholipase
MSPAVNYHLFDAFLVLHGTDTMAYTVYSTLTGYIKIRIIFKASALSFMLEDLGKSVVLTGSQVPLAEWRTDAEENLLGYVCTYVHKFLYGDY